MLSVESTVTLGHEDHPSARRYENSLSSSEPVLKPESALVAKGSDQRDQQSDPAKQKNRGVVVREILRQFSHVSVLMLPRLRPTSAMLSDIAIAAI